MKVYKTSEIRNVSFIGSAKSGKTTLAEAALLNGKVINRRGTIDDKNTASDYKEIELERQNSVVASVLYTEYEDKKINIIDTPGFDDFVGEVVSALTVTEGAVLVINGQNGVEVGAEQAWRNAKNSKTPLIIAVNQMEHEKTNFDEVLSSIKASLTPKAVLIHYPINPGPGFNAVIDVLKMKYVEFSDGKSVEKEIPAQYADKAEELRGELIEVAAEGEEELMEIFFDKGTLTEEELIRGLRLCVINRNAYPIVCASSKENKGVVDLLSIINKILPAPDEISIMESENGEKIQISSNGKLSLFIFKISSEPHLGEVSIFKVVSGKISEGTDIINKRRENRDRITQLLIMAGKNRVKIESIEAGDIGATIKLKENRVSDTINEKDNELIVKKVNYPEPKFRTAIKAVNSTDEEKLTATLLQMAKEDPTLLVGYSKELKQMIVQSQGELRMAILKWYLDNIYKIETEYKTPKIEYRETITKSAKSMYRHKKQSGGAGQFGEIHIVVEPYEDNKPYIKEMPIRGNEIIEMPWGGKLEFVNCIVGGSIDARFLPAVLKGVMEKMEEGPLTGSYARDIRLYLHDGKMHPVDSNEISFKLAGRYAFSQAFKEAGPKILEPIYDVEVLTPEDRMGDVMTDLQGRRSIIMGMEPEENDYKTIKARVPLAEMNKYSTSLSSLSNGRASYSMKYADYQQVPGDVQDQLLKAYEAENKEE